MLKCNFGVWFISILLIKFVDIYAKTADGEGKYGIGGIPENCAANKHKTSAMVIVAKTRRRGKRRLSIINKSDFVGNTASTNI